MGFFAALRMILNLKEIHKSEIINLKSDIILS